MSHEKRIENYYDPEAGIVLTALNGLVSMEDVLIWQEGYRAAIDEAMAHGPFSVLTDGVGYEAASFDVHIAWRDAFMALTSEADAVAFVHHNQFKMESLQAANGNNLEGYFHDADTAWEWLLSHNG